MKNAMDVWSVAVQCVAGSSHRGKNSKRRKESGYDALVSFFFETKLAFLWL